jgi:hypothetical protein
VSQCIEMANGTVVELDGPLVELREPPAPVVHGYCLQCRGYALGPRYEPTTPSDVCDWITGHDGCPGYQPN